MDVDTSTYPKAPAPTTPFDVAGKLGSMQSQSLGIDQQKLDQANQALGYMTRAMGSIGPEGTFDQYFGAAQNAVKMGLVPQEMLNTYTEQMKASKSPQEFYNRFMTAAAQHKEQMDWYSGQQQLTPVGNAIIPTRTPQKPGGTTYSTGAPIATQPPPTTEIVDNDPNSPTYGQKKLSTGQPSIAPPGMVTAPPMVGGTRLPVLAPKRGGMLGGMSGSAPGETIGVGGGNAIEPPPLFDEGKKGYVEDQTLATKRLTGIKPALQVLPLLKDLQTGPGTATFNKAVAGLKAFGILPTGTAANDTTAIYQIVNKKLQQYLAGSSIAQRSDAAQELASEGSPNAGAQINPALVKLTKDAIALDRLEAIRSSEFGKTGKDKTGKDTFTRRSDFHNYGEHRATFPARMDERALSIDYMDNDERQALLEDIDKKLSSKNANERHEAQKFKETLAAGKRARIFNMAQ